MARFPVAAFAALATVTLAAQDLPDLLASARPAEEVLAFENDFVRVGLVALEYPAAERRVAEARPVVLYIRLTPSPGVLNTKLLEPPRGAAPSWRPGVVPRAVHIELLRSPLRPTRSRGARHRSAFRCQRGAGLAWRSLAPGRVPLAALRLRHGPISLRDDLSVGRDGRGVEPGAYDAAWACRRAMPSGSTARRGLTVLTDEPVGVAIVQLYPP